MRYKYKAKIADTVNKTWIVYRFPEEHEDYDPIQAGHDECIVWHAGSEEAAINVAKRYEEAAWV